jgi:hypothetical protein
MNKNIHGKFNEFIGRYGVLIIPGWVLLEHPGFRNWSS